VGLLERPRVAQLLVGSSRFVSDIPLPCLRRIVREGGVRCPKRLERRPERPIARASRPGWELCAM